MKRDAAWREKRLRYLLESERSEDEAYARFHWEFPGEKPDEALKEGKAVLKKSKPMPKEAKR